MMAPDGQTLAPNVYDAEPTPEAARAEIDRRLREGMHNVIVNRIEHQIHLLRRNSTSMVTAMLTKTNQTNG